MSSTGVIKKFFEDKGFGFVTPDEGGDDVFVHVKDNPDLEGCQQGDAVSYDAEWDDRKGKYKGVNLSVSGGAVRYFRWGSSNAFRAGLLYICSQDPIDAPSTAPEQCEFDIPAVGVRSEYRAAFNLDAVKFHIVVNC